MTDNLLAAGPFNDSWQQGASQIWELKLLYDNPRTLGTLVPRAVGVLLGNRPRRRKQNQYRPVERLSGNYSHHRNEVRILCEQNCPIIPGHPPKLSRLRAGLYPTAVTNHVRRKGDIRLFLTPSLVAKPDLVLNFFSRRAEFPFDDMTSDQPQCSPPDRFLTISDLLFVRLVGRGEVLDHDLSIGHEGLLFGEKWKVAPAIRLDARIHKCPVKIPAVNIHCDPGHVYKTNARSTDRGGCFGLWVGLQSLHEIAFCMYQGVEKGGRLPKTSVTRWACQQCVGRSAGET